MSTAVDRMGRVLRIDPAWAWLIAVIGLCGVAASVALATRLGVLHLALGAASLGLLTLIGFRWPLVPLALFAALIPIEEVVVVEGLGTISRFAGILFAVTYGVPRLGRLTFGAMPAAGWAFMAWAAVSLGWAMDAEIARGEMLTLLQLFVVAVFVADFVVHQPQIVRPLLWIYSISAAVTATVGVWSYLGQGLTSDVRAAAIESQNPAQFAAVLLPAFVFGLHELLNGDRRVLGGVIAFITTLGIVVSGTRGAWVAAAVVVALVILPQLRPRQRAAAIAASAVLLVVMFQIPGVADLVTERTGTAVSSGGAGRTDIWSVGLTMYASAPVFGVGWANFPVAYTPEVVQASDASSWRFAGGRAPHNIIIGTAVELGVIGLILLALFVGPLILRRGWGPDAGTVQAALAALLTLALFLDVLANRKQVWLVIGLAAGLAYLARQHRRETSQGDLDAGR